MALRQERGARGEALQSSVAVGLRWSFGTDARNEPSRQVAERVGFVLEGHLRNAFLAPDGQPADELVFALTPDDARLRPT